MNISRARIFLSILLALAASASARGQAPNRFAYFDVSFYEQGDASIELSFNFDARSEGQALTEGLEKALGCHLHDVVWKPGSEKESMEFLAYCDGALRRRGLMTRGEIDASAIGAVLLKENVAHLTVDAEFPDAAIDKCHMTGGGVGASEDDGECTFEIPLPDSGTTRIQIVYGYDASNMARIFLPLGVFIALAIGVGFWARRGALRKAKTDPMAAWFGYARFLQWIALGNYFVWWTIADAVRLNDFLLFALNSVGYAPAHWALAPFDFFIRLAPPGVLNMIAVSLSQPVQSEVRGSEATVREVAIQSAWAQALFILPVGFFLAGMGTMVNADDQRSAVLWLFLAYFSYILIARKLAKARQYTPYTLTTGELRDRAFAIAGAAGVKLRQVYVLSTTRTRVANAFARNGNSILLTDFLLRHMSKREVDSILAHEIAHLKYRHPKILGFVYLAAAGGAGLLWGTFEDRFPRGTPLFPVLVVLASVSIYAISRGFERSADAESARLTGDPESSIRALVKLSTLNLVPIQWSKISERFITHPSIYRRVHRIAKLSGVDAARVDEIISNPGDTSDHYAFAATEATGARRIFSGELKRSISFRAAWMIIGAIILLPALCAFLANLEHLHGALLWTAYFIGAILSGTLAVVAANFIPRLGKQTLPRGLAVKLNAEGILAESWGGKFMGFSPAPVPRLYENNYFWDVGFLMLDNDHFVFVGEEVRFKLNLASVTSIQFGPGPPGWWTYPNLYITWSVSGGTAGGTFSLCPADAGSIHQVRTQIREAGERLQAWKERRLDLPALPPMLIALEPPKIGEVTSASPRNAIKPLAIFRQILFLVFVAAGVSLLFGLQFELSSPQNSPAAQNVAAQGWYVVLITILVSLLQMIPYWRSRESVR